MRNYFIEVEGEIIAKDVKQYAVNWACGAIGGDPESIADNYDYDKESHAVKGNLVLDNNKRAVPYATYYTKKGIQVYGGGGVSAYGSGPGPAFAYYRDNIEKLKAKLEIKVPEEVQDSLYNGLYLEGFSILELFLSDFLYASAFNLMSCLREQLHIFVHKRQKMEKVSRRVTKNIPLLIWW